MNCYKVLNKQTYSLGDYAIVPIRDEDKWEIMKWRNEQIYHLRQSKPLTVQDQEAYFSNVVYKLFEQEKPSQLLFSFLYRGKCIGYGGLVHINWIDKNAEISFIMDTDLEKTSFHKNWSIFLFLIEKIAFKQLTFHKIFTYAFDLRPKLYEALESCGYKKEAVLKEHCYFEDTFKDVIIHSKVNTPLIVRTIEAEDKDLIYEWANDEQTRLNSFNSQPIPYDNHSAWFDQKLKDSNALYFICEFENTPAGLLRFDIAESEATIGIIIGEKFRGKGLALSFIHSCSQVYRLVSGNVIKAFIKPTNVASKKSFERAGFIYKGNHTINNIEALLYEYN